MYSPARGVTRSTRYTGGRSWEFSLRPGSRSRHFLFIGGQDDAVGTADTDCGFKISKADDQEQGFTFLAMKRLEIRRSRLAYSLPSLTNLQFVDGRLLQQLAEGAPSTVAGR